jgi:pyruvate dehydrogenase E2 component (dihydrolipoamide acetyltransferase)
MVITPIILYIKSIMPQSYERRPMSEIVILPKWGLTMDEGTVTAWRKQEGDQVAEGEVLVEVQTDKINNELPSPINGIVAVIHVPEGETVPVGSALVTIASSLAEAAEIRQQLQ